MPTSEPVRDIDGNQIVISVPDGGFDGFLGNFDCFTEWASEADCKAFVTSVTR